MSGLGQGRRPRTNEEIYREVDRRLNALERAGSWRFNDRDGELWATAPGRTPINLSAMAAIVDGFAPTIEKSGLWRKTITLLGSPGGGSFVLVYNDMPTANIAYNASATTVQTRIIDLSTELNTSNVLVSGSNGGPWTLVAPSGTLYASWDNLTGGTTPSVEIT